MRTKNFKENKVNIVTLGCSKNQVDSEDIATQLKHNNTYKVAHNSEQRDANIIIVNTCGFIESAKEESINTILHYASMKEKGKIEKLYATGCLTQRYREELSQEIKGVDGWFGTFDMPDLLAQLNVNYKHNLVGEKLLSTPSHYAYLKISEGCNRTCSFCAIPLMRGQHKSKSIEDILLEAKNLAQQGVKEIMLIAQELTYYGLDIYKKRALADLLYQLNEVEGIEWIRLHYAYPSKFPFEIVEAMAKCNKVCNYLDMPLQHASDNILHAMKRQITKQETIDLINSIRNKIPDISIRTTMLVGFPGETEQDFEELCDFVKEMRFDRLGVFTYSHEDSTSGYLLEDNLSEEEKNSRASKLMHIQEEISEQLNEKKIGSIQKVLIDRVDDEYYYGRTQYDSPEVDNEVLIAHNNEVYARIGDFIQVEIEDAGPFDLYGSIIN
jgi:ribosomal protein S12 methylthiotransferase